MLFVYIFWLLSLFVIIVRVGIILEFNCFVFFLLVMLSDFAGGFCVWKPVGFFAWPELGCWLLVWTLGFCVWVDVWGWYKTQNWYFLVLGVYLVALVCVLCWLVILSLVEFVGFMVVSGTFALVAVIYICGGWVCGLFSLFEFDRIRVCGILLCFDSFIVC